MAVGYLSSGRRDGCDETTARRLLDDLLAAHHGLVEEQHDDLQMVREALVDETLRLDDLDAEIDARSSAFSAETRARFPGLWPDGGARPVEHGSMCFCVDCLGRANTPKPLGFKGWR